MKNTARLRGDLVNRLRAQGVLTEQPWIYAFTEIPRHEFVRKCFVPDRNGWRAMDSADAGWLEIAYGDEIVATQLDGDPTLWALAREHGPVPGIPTCSSSMPAIMAIMLEELAVPPHARTLEIGTGTGYNAALLCHRLGAANVTTVDVDEQLVATARENLSNAGAAPTVVRGDGALGAPENAPYQRILATCSVSRIPLPWLAQCTPDARIITTLHRQIGAGLVRVDATGHGRVLAQDGRFMPLRAHDQGMDFSLAANGNGPSRSAVLQPAAVLDSGSPFEFFAGLTLDRVQWTGTRPGPYLLAHDDGSWVRHHGPTVVQGGPRALWDLVESAHDRWLTLGSPRRDRFGITVTRDAQWLWLDSPDALPRWPLD
jgi:protein-L-isoaspartate O-methyltransferase